MRVVPGLARLLLVVGVAGLLVAGCDSAQSPETEPAATPPTPDGAAPGTLTLTSPAFADGGAIPAKYCRAGVPGGTDVSIPLVWSGAPEGTRSFAITMIDRHRAANDWVHWTVVDIPASVTELAEGASGADMPAGAAEPANTFGDTGYGGPQPPAGSGDHDYEITVYALDTEHVQIGERPSAADIERALAGRVLAFATLTGTFGR